MAFGLWKIFFPTEETYTEDVEIQPSYKHMRHRSELMRQIRKSKLKLRKTFIVHQYDNTTYRLPELDLNNTPVKPVIRSNSDPSPIQLWYQ